MMSMDFMPARRDRGEEGSAVRRIRRTMLLFRIGMISTIRRAQIATRNTNIAMRKFEKLESGRTDCTRIGKLLKLRVTETVMTKMTIALQ